MKSDDLFYSFVIPVIEQIKKRYPKAKAIAIENFLSTAVNYSMNINLLNLDMDRKIYKWDRETYKAIYHGLQLLHSLGIIKS